MSSRACPGIQKMKTFYVYILASQRNGTLYVGVTSDLSSTFQNTPWSCHGDEWKHKILPTGFNTLW